MEGKTWFKDEKLLINRNIQAQSASLSCTNLTGNSKKKKYGTSNTSLKPEINQKKKLKKN